MSGCSERLADHPRLDGRLLRRRFPQFGRPREDEDLDQGQALWTRTIGSTVIGEGADSLIFYPLAFYGMADWPVAILGR